MPDDRSSFITRWHVHLKRRSTAEGYGVRESMPNTIVDNHIPPLLLLQTMELFDQGQKIVLAERPDIMPSRPTLGGRARALRDAGILRNGDRVLGFVEARNEVAHGLKFASWQTLGVVIDEIHSELAHLGLGVGEIPNYSVAATSQRIDCPHCEIHLYGVIRLLQDGEPVELVGGWQERVGNVPHTVRIEDDELVVELLGQDGASVSVTRLPCPPSIQH
jgi:hypothetical protein